MQIFIVVVDLNRGEAITKEEIQKCIQDELYDSPVIVKEIK